MSRLPTSAKQSPTAKTAAIDLQVVTTTRSVRGALRKGAYRTAAGLAEVVILGLLAAWVFKKAGIPELVGILLAGIVLGPYVMDALSPELMHIGADLRLIALVVILLRAGFELSRTTLNRVGLQALLLSFVPAVFEGTAITFLGPALLGLSLFESAILGSVLAAVSPAVVVPLMIQLIERRKGTEKGIPTMVLAASSLDDVFVIVVYSVLIGIYTGQNVNIAFELVGIPVSILLGIGVGLLIGYGLYHLFRIAKSRATKRVLIVLGLALLIVRVENLLKGVLPFAGLLAVMAIGFIILEKQETMAHESSAKLGKIWVFAEIILFSMVGTQVNLPVALHAGGVGIAIVALGLVARSVGTFVSLIRSGLTIKEETFVILAYLPKATVQAAIGAAALAAMEAAGMSTVPGEIILAIAVISILLTAPLGAIAIKISGERFLSTDLPDETSMSREERPSALAEETSPVS